MAGKDVNQAASRILSLLGDEDRRKRRVNSMMERLRRHGWTVPRPARPAQGGTLADAAGAIEARLAADGALRREAETQVAAVEAADEGLPLEFQSAGPEADGNEMRPGISAGQSQGDPHSLQFKKDNSIDEWRWAVPAMARYVGIDEDAAIQADSDIVPILAGMHVYRQLDPRSRQGVLALIDKMSKNEYRPDLWPLAGTLQGQVAAAQASPFQSLWSMSDDEIRDHIRRQEEFLNILDYTGDAQDVGELGLAAAGAANIARSVTVPGAVANGVLLAAKYATKANKAHLESVLENRRNGGNPFDHPPQPWSSP